MMLEMITGLQLVIEWERMSLMASATATEIVCELELKTVLEMALAIKLDVHICIQEIHHVGLSSLLH
jgi:hypothetical protein